MTKTATFVCALVLLAGCGPTARRPAESSYYPLGVGSQWRYSVYYVDSSGQRVADEPTSSNEVRVLGRAELAGGESAMAVVSGYDRPYQVFETSYVRNAGGCVVSRLKLDSKLCDTVLVLPPEAGKAWQRLVGGKPRIRAQFAAQETVRVAAGAYFAWRVDETLDSSSLRNSLWYAPGVGLVRVEVLIQPQGGRLVVDLTSASVKW